MLLHCLEKELVDSKRSIVRRALHVRDKATVAINSSMHHKSPPDQLVV